MSALKTKYIKEVRPALKSTFKYKNDMQVPLISKIVVHRGLGEATSNSKCVEMTQNTLYKITGQKPIVTKAKKSISNFKLREGQSIGCKVTLRGDKMYDFLTKLLNIVLPKIRDFRGVSPRGFDKFGNYTFGLTEDIVFPEVNYDELDKTRGMDITIVTTGNTKEEARLLLECCGMPFSDKK